MVPLYVTPFENICPEIKEKNEEMRRILALDSPYPILKNVWFANLQFFRFRSILLFSLLGFKDIQ